MKKKINKFEEFIDDSKREQAIKFIQNATKKNSKSEKTEAKRLSRLLDAYYDSITNSSMTLETYEKEILKMKKTENSKGIFGAGKSSDESNDEDESDSVNSSFKDIIEINNDVYNTKECLMFQPLKEDDCFPPPPPLNLAQSAPLNKRHKSKKTNTPKISIYTHSTS